MMYTPEDFPVGTVVEVRGGAAYAVTYVRPTSELDKTLFSVYLQGHYSVMPNWEGTEFRRIVSTPRVQDAKPEKSEICAGDRVRVTPILSGMTGSSEGVVREVNRWKYMVAFPETSDAVSIMRNSGTFRTEKIELTWQQKLDALPVRSILEGKNAEAGRFAVKMGQTFWAISGWTRMVESLSENEWELPND